MATRKRRPKGDNRNDWSVNIAPHYAHQPYIKVDSTSAYETPQVMHSSSFPTAVWSNNTKNKKGCAEKIISKKGCVLLAVLGFLVSVIISGCVYFAHWNRIKKINKKAASITKKGSDYKNEESRRSIDDVFWGEKLSLDVWPESWSPDTKRNPLAPAEKNANIWDGSPVYLLKTFAGHTPHSVSQYFSPKLLSDTFSNNALKRAKKWASEQRTTWCGTSKNPDTFDVNMFPRYAGSAKVWYGCPNSKTARMYLEQAITQRYAFNDNEAYCSFKKALEIDPGCMLARLGIALALGPNVNYGFVYDEVVYQEIISALNDTAAIAAKLPDELTGQASVDKSVSFALLDALQRRYLPFVDNDTSVDVDEGSSLMTRVQMSAANFEDFQRDFHALNADYANATLDAHTKLPENDLIGILTVGALMQNPSWKWWAPGSDFANYTKHNAMILSVGDKIHPNAARANRVINDVLSRDSNNLGANHYFIHNVEGGPQPLWGLAVADRLQRLDPGGHAQHMSTHIYSRLGHWMKSIEWNKRANFADFSWAKSRANGYILTPFYRYESHNIAFQCEAAMHVGNWAELASALSLQNQMVAFRVSASPKQVSSVNTLMDGYLYPLRFGLYKDVLRDIDDSPVGKKGQYEYAAQKYFVSSTVLLARQHAVATAAARVGDTDLAVSALTDLLTQLLPSTQKTTTSQNSLPFCTNATTYDCVEAACNFFLRDWDKAQTTAATLTHESEEATGTGTLTIDNSDAQHCLFVLVPFADLAVARANSSNVDKKQQEELELAEIMLSRAWEIQKLMQYDEPSPWYYPIAATLGKVQIMLGRYEDAAGSFREGLFRWPRSVHLVVGLNEALRRGGEGEEQQLDEKYLKKVFSYNDTVILLDWL